MDAPSKRFHLFELRALRGGNLSLEPARANFYS
jgi:hypothetical protein